MPRKEPRTLSMDLDGRKVYFPEGATVLRAAELNGVEVPSLCSHKDLSPFGGCRLCVVEIGEGDRTKLVSSCTYPVEEGLVVRTDTKRVWAARRMMVELMLAMAPGSKVLQDIASEFGVTQVRFKPKNEECVLCGLCIRMCDEQMDARAIGFQSRGHKRKISTPFDIKNPECRLCGGCIYVCPACQLRCQGPQAETAICNGCLTMDPTCLDHYDDLQCWMYDNGQCGTCVREKAPSGK